VEQLLLVRWEPVHVGYFGKQHGPGHDGVLRITNKRECVAKLLCLLLQGLTLAPLNGQMEMENELKNEFAASFYYGADCVVLVHC
jgi:hypothetical protein